MRVLRRQDGFTLVELLAAMSVGSIVLLAAFGLMDTVLARSTEIQQRVEATADGRRAMDEMTRSLRSLVCPAPGGALVASGSTGSRVVHRASLGTGAPGTVPDTRTFELTPAGRLVETVVAGGVTSTRTLLEAAAPDGSTLFAYRAFATDGSRALEVLPTPLSAANALRVARIDVALRVRAAGGPSGPSVAFADSVFVRVANPNDAVPTPTCS